MKRPTAVLCLLFCSISLLLRAQQYDTSFYQDQFRHIRSLIIDSSDATQAMTLLQELPSIQDTLTKRYRHLQAEKEELICRCHYSNGQYDQAISRCKKALSLTDEISGTSSEKVGNLYSLLGAIYGSQGKTQEGIEVEEKAYELFSSLYGDRHPRVSICKQSLGGKYIMDAQSDEVAEKGHQYLKEALAVQLEEWGENNINTAMTFHYLGKYYNRKGQYYKSLDYQKKALQIHLMQGRERASMTFYIYRVIGLLHQRLGDFRAAEDFLKIALEGNQARLGEDHVMLSLDYYGLSVICKNANRLDQAANYLQKAISLISQKYGSEHIGLPHMYEGLGQIYIDKGEFKKGIEINQKALGIWQSNYPEPTENFTYSLNNIATGYSLMGEYETAIKYYQETLQIYEQTNSLKIPQVANVYVGLARACAQTGDRNQARNYYKQALTTLGFQETEDHFTEIQSFSVLMHVLTSYGEFLKEWSVVDHSKTLQDQAKQVYDLAFRALDQMQLEIQSPESQQFIQKESIARLFEPYIALDLQDHLNIGLEAPPEKPFEVAERSKALSLLMATNKSNAYQFEEKVQILVEKEEEIRAAIKEREQYLANEKSKGELADAKIITKLNEQLNHYRKELYANLTTLQQDYPEYYQLRHQLDVYEVSQARLLLTDEETALIEYFVGNENIYAFIITKGHYQVIEIPIDSNLKAWIAALRDYMVDFTAITGRPDEDAYHQAQLLSELLHNIYQHTFAPIEAQLDLPEQLIIVPDGVLGYVPFEMLLRQIPDDPNLFASHDYLIKDYQISYTYSATILGQTRSMKKNNSKKPFLAFAPEFQDEINPAKYNTFLANRNVLGPLEYNIPEAQSLQHLMGGEAFIGNQATEAAFVQHASNYRVIHLATHAKADDQVGDYAYLAFAEIPDSIENELLYNRELYQLGLEADMVVLSACETGTGELQRGEGIISLARGFSYAGAKSIITTLWSVDDQKTKELMESFYGYIKSGQPKDAALRQAKLDFIDRYSHDAHPIYWAAFIPIGDMRPIDFNTGQPMLRWGILLAMLLTISLLYLRQSKHHKSTTYETY